MLRLSEGNERYTVTIREKVRGRVMVKVSVRVGVRVRDPSGPSTLASSRCVSAIVLGPTLRPAPREAACRRGLQGGRFSVVASSGEVQSLHVGEWSTLPTLLDKRCMISRMMLFIE